MQLSAVEIIKVNGRELLFSMNPYFVLIPFRICMKKIDIISIIPVK